MFTIMHFQFSLSSRSYGVISSYMYQRLVQRVQLCIGHNNGTTNNVYSAQCVRNRLMTIQEEANAKTILLHGTSKAGF